MCGVQRMIRSPSSSRTRRRVVWVAGCCGPKVRVQRLSPSADISGPEEKGPDPAPLATTTARDRYGVNAITGSFVTPPETLGRFDVITLCHVLEHLSDVGGAITAIDRLLEPDGVVYVEVPDAARYAGICGCVSRARLRRS